METGPDRPDQRLFDVEGDGMHQTSSPQPRGSKCLRRFTVLRMQLQNHTTHLFYREDLAGKGPRTESSRVFTGFSS
jgi:hypothetical protein